MLQLSLRAPHTASLRELQSFLSGYDSKIYRISHHTNLHSTTFQIADETALGTDALTVEGIEWAIQDFRKRANAIGIINISWDIWDTFAPAQAVVDKVGTVHFPRKLVSNPYP